MYNLREWNERLQVCLWVSLFFFSFPFAVYFFLWEFGSIKHPRIFFFRIDNGPPAHLEGCRERGQPSDL
jgi:hypothetical protein